MEIALSQFNALIHNSLPLLATAFPPRDQGRVHAHQRTAIPLVPELR